MKADITYILTFDGLDAETDREVRNCAAALHFKHASRGRSVEWVHFSRTDGNFQRVTAQGATLEPLRDIFRTVPDGAGTRRPIVSVYAISHGGTGAFGGFTSPEDGAEVLGNFMFEVDIDTIDQLSLVACATAKGPRGATYLEELARAMSRYQRRHDSLKVIGWENYVTIFDPRFLVRMLMDAKVPESFVAEIREEFIGILGRGGTDFGGRFIEELVRDFDALVATPGLGKALKKEHFGEIQAALIERPVQAPALARQLLGKKVVRATGTKMFFTRATGLQGSTDSVALPDELPAEAMEVLRAAVANKRNRTFVWRVDADTPTPYLAPAAEV